MTTETKDVSAVLAEMQSLLAQQAAEIATLRASSPDAGMDRVMSEYEAGLIQSGRMTRNLPGQKMVGPCLHVSKEGKECRRPWSEHVPEMDSQRARIADHSYREVILPRSEKKKPRGYYKRDDAPIATVEAAPEDAFMAVGEAAKALGIAVKECREMIADGSLGVVRIGRVVLVKRQAVERILAIAAIEEEV